MISACGLVCSYCIVRRIWYTKYPFLYLAHEVPKIAHPDSGPAQDSSYLKICLSFLSLKPISGSLCSNALLL
jgi:hypothetical protein